MQSARIWFRQSNQEVSIFSLEAFLREALHCDVELVEWRLGSFVVPQVQVLKPRRFLLQIANDATYVLEEAQEFAERSAPSLLEEQVTFCRACDSRLEIGLNDPPPVLVPNLGMTAFSGFTNIDPAEPEIQTILKAITRRVRGVFEDNVNGNVWFPD